MITSPTSSDGLDGTILGQILAKDETLTDEQKAVREARVAHTHSDKFLKDRSLFITRMSIWTGGKTVSEDELAAAGITDVEGYLKTHSKGSKFLVDKKSISQISKIKSRFTSALNRLTRPYAIENIRLVEISKLDEAVAEVMKWEKELREEVERFLTEDYSAQVEASVAKSLKEYPGMSENKIRSEFPTPNVIRARHRVIFEILPTPHAAKFSDMVNEYQLRKADEQIRQYVEMTSFTLRRTLVQVLESFREILGRKDPDQKVNAKSIRHVNETFDAFLNMAPSIGDNRITQTILACRSKFAEAASWTKEEVVALGLEDVIKNVVAAANDDAAVLVRQEEYLGSLSIEGDVVVPTEEVNLAGLGMERRLEY